MHCHKNSLLASYAAAVDLLPAMWLLAGAHQDNLKKAGCSEPDIEKYCGAAEFTFRTDLPQ